MKLFSIIAYCLIFLPGSMVLLPFGLLLITGLFDAEPTMRMLIALADIALVGLVIVSFRERTKWTLVIEIVAYFLLLAPLIRIVTLSSLENFDYLFFLVPAGCFAVFFPVAVLRRYRMPVKKDTKA